MPAESVLVVGATGLTGEFLLPLLIEQGYQVNCLVRNQDKAEKLRSNTLLRVLYGNINDPLALSAALEGVQFLVHIPNILSVNHLQTLECCRLAGVRRAVFFSTTAIFTTIPSEHRAHRLKAEREILAAPLETVILRPTMIYGSARDKNMSRLIRYLSTHRVLPVVGDGRALQQPVYAGDVAFAITQALARPEAVGRTYNLPGKQPIEFNALVKEIAAQLGRAVRLIHLPAWPVIQLVSLLEKGQIALPLRSEQLIRLRENKVFDYNEACGDLEYSPLAFADGIRREIASLQLPSHQ